ncbi:hypothetical protein ACHAPD_007841 [Fusarium lateritium]
MSTSELPTMMYAWRKHRGSPKPTPIPDMVEVYEEVPVPSLSSNGILCKMLTSGGTSNVSPSEDPKLTVISLSK